MRHPLPVTKSSTTPACRSLASPLGGPTQHGCAACLLCAVSAQSLQSCPILCDPLDCSLPGCSVCGILQSRIPECVAIFFSRGSSLPRHQTLVTCVAGGFFTTELPGKPHYIAAAAAAAAAKSLQLCPTLCDPIDAAHQTPLSTGFSRQED